MVTLWGTFQLVNKTRDFKSEIYNEIRNHLKCDFIKNDPSHFCTKKELCSNLHMSLRDLTSSKHGLSALVEEKLLNHDHAVQNGVRCDRFTISDPNTYTSKEIINSKKDHIKWQKKLIAQYCQFISRPRTVLYFMAHRWSINRSPVYC